MKNNSIGFFALWKNKNSEYKATSEEELETTIKISECFQFAKSKNILISAEGTYAQSATWSESESKGFIKLIGQSTSTWSNIHNK